MTTTYTILDSAPCKHTCIARRPCICLGNHAAPCICRDPHCECHSASNYGLSLDFSRMVYAPVREGARPALLFLAVQL